MKTRTRATSWLLILIAAAFVVGCGGKEERAANYLARANAAFDQGDLIKAELDAKNALQITPNSFEASYLLAQIAEQENSPQKMFRFLRRSVEIDPSNVEAQVKLGRIWAAAGQLEGARESVAAIELADPGNLEGIVLEATVLLREGKIEEARALGNDVLAKSPRNISALAFLASTYQVEDVERSLEMLSRAISYEPDNQSLRVVKITILQKEGRHAAAEKELRDLIGLFPDENAYRYALARYLASQKRGDEARTVLEDIVSADPEDSTAKLSLAQFLGQQGDGAGAVKLLQEYISDAPDVYQFRFALAQSHSLLKDFDSAKSVYRDIIDRDGLGPNGLSARTKLAAIELSRGDEAVGRSLIAEVLDEEPSNPDALSIRATLAMAAGDFDDATVDLRSVLRADPTRQNAQLLLGKAHAQSGQTALAVETYQKLVESAPANVDARKDLARLYARAQRWDDVSDVLQLGVQQRPGDLAMARLYVDALLRQQKWDIAEAQAQRILDIDPSKALGHYVKGRVLQARGDYQASTDSLQVALDVNPGASEVLTAIVRNFVRLDDRSGGVQYVQSYLDANPDSAHGLSLLGEMQARDGQWDAAKASNLKALDVRDTWLPAYRNLIGIHLRDKDFDAANATLQRGLKAAPGNIELLLLEANVLEQTGRYGDAIDNYEAILTSNSSLAVAANNYIALVADHRNDAESLEKAARFAEELDAEANPIFQDTLGWLAYRRGRYDEAQQLLEGAVRRAGQIPQLRYHLGMTYFRQDRLTDARRELEAALQDDSSVFTGKDEAKEVLAGL
ncbi:MAG: tetratricopeptide repeat protein [Gammaproteobacteria bacterium]